MASHAHVAVLAALACRSDASILRVNKAMAANQNGRWVGTPRLCTFLCFGFQTGQARKELRLPTLLRSKTKRRRAAHQPMPLKGKDVLLKPMSSALPCNTIAAIGSVRNNQLPSRSQDCGFDAGSVSLAGGVNA